MFTVAAWKNVETFNQPLLFLHVNILRHCIIIKQAFLSLFKSNDPLKIYQNLHVNFVILDKPCSTNPLTFFNLEDAISAISTSPLSVPCRKHKTPTYPLLIWITWRNIEVAKKHAFLPSILQVANILHWDYCRLPHKVAA